MTQDEAEDTAHKITMGLWHVRPSLRLWRYRPWLVCGPRWEASGSIDGRKVQVIIDDKTGEPFQARMGKSGLFPRKPLVEMVPQVLTLVVLLLLLGAARWIATGLPPWALWVLSLSAGIAGIVWARLLVFQRRHEALPAGRPSP